MSYTDRLLHLNLPTLKYRRLRGDMIEVFKITHGIYDLDASLKLAYHPGSVARGIININFSTIDFIMIYVSTIFLHVLLIFGTVYLITLWRLTCTVNLFKARLDRFWANQDVKYNFTADLTGIGDRSAYEICDI